MADSVHRYVKGSKDPPSYLDWNRQLEDKARYEPDENQFQHIAQIYRDEGRITQEQYEAVLAFRRAKNLQTRAE